MNDKTQAAIIKTKINELNDAIQTAHSMGLSVDVITSNLQSIQDAQPCCILRCEIKRIETL